MPFLEEGPRPEGESLGGLGAAFEVLAQLGTQAFALGGAVDQAAGHRDGLEDLGHLSLIHI